MLSLDHKEVNKYFRRIYMKNIFEVSEKELETIAGAGGDKFSDGEAVLTGLAVGGMPMIGSAFGAMSAAENDGADYNQMNIAAATAVVGSAVSSLVPMGIGAGLLKFKQWLDVRSKKAKAREMREIMDMARNLK